MQILKMNFLKEPSRIVKPHPHERLKSCELGLLASVNDKTLFAAIKTQMPALRVEMA